MARTRICAGALLLMAGCDASPPRHEAAPAANKVPAGPQAEKVLKSEMVEAVFTGWEQGDYLWARLEVKGRAPIGAWSGPSPIDLFLDAHIGKPLTIRLETIDAEIPEAGGRMEVPRVADARLGTLTAAAWWAALSSKQRQDAQISLAGSLEPRPPEL